MAANANVLLIEDDAAIRTSLTRGLRDRGHAVSSASAALDGLRLAVEDRPDLIVLDLGLPDMDGRDLLRMLRAVSRVPVIVATARDGEAEMVRLLDAGADDYVVKPFSAAQLDARIRAVLRRAGGPPCRQLGTVGGAAGGPAGPGGDAGRRAAGPDAAGVRPAALPGRPGRAGGHQTRAAHRGLAACPYGGADKTVDVHLSWLRRKLGETAHRPPLPADRPGCRASGLGRLPGAMRRWLALLVAATTVARPGRRCWSRWRCWCRTVAAAAGPSTAADRARPLGRAVGASPARRTSETLRLTAEQLAASGHPVTVFLPDGQVIGAAGPPHRRRRAGRPRRSASPRRSPGGREILVAVQGAPGGTAVVRAFLERRRADRGVAQAWLVLAGLGSVLVGLGILVADRLARAVIRPITALARVSHRLATGDLTARATRRARPRSVRWAWPSTTSRAASPTCSRRSGRRWPTCPTGCAPR